MDDFIACITDKRRKCEEVTVRMHAFGEDPAIRRLPRPQRAVAALRLLSEAFYALEVDDKFRMAGRNMSPAFDMERVASAAKQMLVALDLMRREFYELTRLAGTLGALALMYDPCPDGATWQSNYAALGVNWRDYDSMSGGQCVDALAALVALGPPPVERRSEPCVAFVLQELSIMSAVESGDERMEVSGDPPKGFNTEHIMREARRESRLDLATNINRIRAILGDPVELVLARRSLVLVVTQENGSRSAFQRVSDGGIAAIGRGVEVERWRDDHDGREAINELRGAAVALTRPISDKLKIEVVNYADWLRDESAALDIFAP